MMPYYDEEDCFIPESYPDSIVLLLVKRRFVREFGESEATNCFSSKSLIYLQNHLDLSVSFNIGIIDLNVAQKMMQAPSFCSFLLVPWFWNPAAVWNIWSVCLLKWPFVTLFFVRFVSSRNLNALQNIWFAKDQHPWLANWNVVSCKHGTLFESASTTEARACYRIFHRNLFIFQWFLV